jgi:hypothetical protein
MAVGSLGTDPDGVVLEVVSVNHPLYMLFAAATPGIHGEEAESDTPRQQAVSTPTTDEKAANICNVYLTAVPVIGACAPLTVTSHFAPFHPMVSRTVAAGSKA